MPIRDEALRWLQLAYDALLTYYVAFDFPPAPGSAAATRHAQIGQALQDTFHTTDWGYVSVLRQRYAHMRNSLASGIVAVNCAAPNDPVCGGGTVAYTANTAYELTLCSALVNPDSVDTFVHELAHATLPVVGIRRSRTAVDGLRDRAYVQDRMIRVMPPDEALDNAETYALFARAFAAGPIAPLITAAVDQPQGCQSDAPVLLAIARVERQITDTIDVLRDALVNLGPPNNVPFADLDAGLVTQLGSFGVTDAAGIRSLRGVYDAISQAIGTDVPLECVADAACRTAGVVGHANRGTVSSGGSGITATTTRRPADSIPVTYLCSAWFSLSADLQNRAFHALYILSHPGDVAGTRYRAADTLLYVNFAADTAAARTPAPTAGSLPHELADSASRNDPDVPRPGMPAPPAQPQSPGRALAPPGRP